MSTLLCEARIGCKINVTSKKRALQNLAELFCAEAGEELKQTEIFDALISRERLGTTGFGHGVAIPHGRLSELISPLIVVTTLDPPIDFDAIDSQKVDLIISLLVPENATDAHVALLSQIAALLRDNEMTQKLRTATSAKEIAELLPDWFA